MLPLQLMSLLARASSSPVLRTGAKQLAFLAFGGFGIGGGELPVFDVVAAVQRAGVLAFSFSINILGGRAQLLKVGGGDVELLAEENHFLGLFGGGDLNGRHAILEGG